MDKEIASIIKRAVLALERIADSLAITSEARYDLVSVAAETRSSPAALHSASGMEAQSTAAADSSRPGPNVTNDTTPAPSAPAARDFTFAELKTAIMAYQDREGWQAAQRILKEFGATYIGQLKPEQYAGVMARVA